MPSAVLVRIRMLCYLPFLPVTGECQRGVELLLVRLSFPTLAFPPSLIYSSLFLSLQDSFSSLEILAVMYLFIHLNCYFCRSCGTRVIHSTPGKDVVSVKGGCIEGLDWRSAKHIWCKRAVCAPFPASPFPTLSETRRRRE
jgi:hypothetical protein